MNALATRRTEKIRLTAPVEWFDKVISEIAIREPSAAAFFKTGPLQMFVGTAGGGGSIVDIPDRLEAYVGQCLDVENAVDFLKVLPLADGRAIKKALLGFFHDAAEETSS